MSKDSAEIVVPLDLSILKDRKVKESKKGEDGSKIEVEKEIKATFTGRVDAVVMPYAERMKLVKMTSSVVNGKAEDAEIDIEAAIENSIKIWEIVKARIRKVSLAHIESGDIIESVTDIDYSEHGPDIIRSINDAFQAGIRLSKNSNP